MKNIFNNIVLLTISIAFTAFLVELVLRIYLEPGNYLSPIVNTDYKLGHVVKPYSAGHDGWGYRNKKVPDKVDIVALGDSQTYGMSAFRKNCWPNILQENTGKSVYNMGLGGYSPIQYYYLLNEKALKLNPKIIIVGLYFGNDFLDTYNMIYTYQYWDKFKDKNINFKNKVFVGEKPRFYDESNKRKIRDFLGRNSILYRIAARSKIGDLFRVTEVKIKEMQDNQNVVVRDKNNDMLTAFTHGGRLGVLDFETKEVNEGFKKTLFLINKMNEISIKKNIAFLVLIIPTKELVYEKYFEKNNDKFKLLFKSVKNEHEARRKLKNFLNDNSISFVDATPYLQRKTGDIVPYNKNDDGHPNKNGYAIIAKTVQDYLQSLNLLN